MFKLVLLILLYFAIIIKSEIPDYISVCRRDDPQLPVCIENSIYLLVPHLKAGIPELDVPPLEPLQLGSIDLKLGPNEKMSSNISDVHVWGASSFKLLDLRVDMSSNTFDFHVVIPTLRLEGRYELDCHILFLKVKGKGPIIINIDQYYFNCTMKGNVITRDSKEYLEFEKMNCNMNFKKADVVLENLFNGNALLGNATNNAINENVNVFFQEIKPTLTRALEESFTDLSNSITKRFTYKELFP